MLAKISKFFINNASNIFTINNPNSKSRNNTMLLNIRFNHPKTIFLVNKFIFPFAGGLSESEVLLKINNLIKNEKHIIPASKICQEELGAEVVSGIYLLGYIVSKNLIPLKKESVLEAIAKVVPEKYLELNKKAFELAQPN